MSWHISKALMSVYENSRSSLEPVAEYSAENSSAGVLSAPSSGSPIPQAYLSPDRMTAFSRLSRFGMTFGPLTDDRGKDLLTWFRAGFPVRTSQQPEREQDSTVNARASGGKWRESLAKYDPDSHSWKTRQFSLLGDSEPFSETWPRWGMTAGGESFLLPTPERPTLGKGSGLWPTARTTGLDGGSNSRNAAKSRGKWPGAMWASPASADAVGSHGGGQGRSLRTDIRNWKRGLWPTPLSTDATYGGPNQLDSSGRPGLSGAVHGGPSTPQTYPTPTCHDGTQVDPPSHRDGTRNQPCLGTIVNKNAGTMGGQLNPEWVEWLMGWPLGWTDLKPLATDKFQRWLDSHGVS